MLKTEYFELTGGEDRITAPLSVAAGALRLSQNYDCNFNGGYRRIDGYERFDGRLSPSEARYCAINVSTALTDVVGSQVRTPSGFYGLVLAARLEDGVGTLALVDVQGEAMNGDAFWIGEDFEQPSDGTFTGDLLENYALSDDDYYAWLSLAQERARSFIEPVPGVGPVRGLFELRDDIYAVRDIDSGQAAIYKATDSGWQAQPLGQYITFTDGANEALRNDTITGATSGATATVYAVTVTSGNWGEDTAAGRLYYKNVEGTFTNGETLEVGGLTVATIDEVLNQSLTAGGKYEYVAHNFFADEGSRAIYAVNGVGPAFSFDGDVFAEIVNGVEDVYPSHISHHREHLFLGYVGGSVLGSSTGKPHEWQATTGAAEFTIGETCTGFLPLVEALVIFGRNSTHVLYGSSIDDYQLKRFSLQTGAIKHTPQTLGKGYFLDDRGFTSMEATQIFGNFQSDTLSTNIDPILRPKHNRVASSTLVRSKNLYRMFFDDGTGITAAFRSNQLVGFTQFRLSHVPYVAETFELSDGKERVFFGSEDGYVYEMERGNSFDGEDITAFLRLHFNHSKSPRLRKRYRKAVFELDAPVKSRILFDADFGYATQDTPEASSQALDIAGGGGFWDTVNWDEFVWSAQVVSEAEARIDGTGTNVGFLISSTGQDASHTLHGVILHYQARRMER